MKTVILTYKVEFDDDVPDENCYASALEIMHQDRYWPSDDQIRIERTDSQPPLESNHVL